LSRDHTLVSRFTRVKSHPAHTTMPRQPLATLPAHPALSLSLSLPGPSAHPHSLSLSAGPSKRPLASPRAEGKRKVSRTENGPKVVDAGTAGAEVADGDGGDVGGSEGSARTLSARAKAVLERDDLGVGSSPARRLFPDAVLDAEGHLTVKDGDEKGKGKGRALCRSPRGLVRERANASATSSPARRLFDDSDDVTNHRT
jgi:hypothetical protein